MQNFNKFSKSQQNLIANRPQNWPILKKNDKAYLIAPASGSLEAEHKKAIEFLESWNIEPIIFQHQYKNKHPFFSHDDQTRFMELKNALYGMESDFIFCLKGGYGSARLLPELLKLEKPKKSKILIGFSDITSLHLALNNYWDLPSLHGPNLGQLALNKVDKQSINWLEDILFNNKQSFSYEILPLNNLAKNIKTNTNLAPLIGGNLSLIQTSIATKWCIKETQKQQYCLLIEEVDEKAYSIDRMLNHLKNSDILQNCQAIFIGDISEKSNSKGQKHGNYVINNFSNNINIAVFRIKNIGHEKTNLAIPLGCSNNITT